MTSEQMAPRDWWRPSEQGSQCRDQGEILAAILRVREPLRLVRDHANGAITLGLNGEIYAAPAGRDGRDLPLVGTLPPLYPEWLGDRGFAETHGCRFPYVVGEMARGIATVDMVIAAARAGFMTFFGSAGLRVETIAENIGRIQDALGPATANWGANLIHSPQDPAAEEATVDLYLARDVRRVSASAYMSLAPSVVRFSASGLTRDADGLIHRRNHVFAKISHPKTASAYMSPPPEPMLRELVAAGGLNAEEAELAAGLPVAEDITVEADSGGHTDNRPLTALFPAIAGLRNDLVRQYGYTRNIRLGAAGGIGTPASVAAAFGLGAAYVLTGSINQCAVESGLSPLGREMLAEAAIDDMAMAPAADMFEMGVKVQVLRRGTMFAVRAQKLYDLYKNCNGLDDIPADEREKLERDVFRASFDDIWTLTMNFFSERNPAEAERAENDPKHRMALVFRWYLFMASQWAREGDGDRRVDYQIWCGPAMGAFNNWTRGSFLEKAENRSVVQIARNLMEGAAIITRAQQLRGYGVAVPPAAYEFRPRPLG